MPVCCLHRTIERIGTTEMAKPRRDGCARTDAAEQVILISSEYDEYWRDIDEIYRYIGFVKAR